MVISIIALLIAMLLPALGSARATARQIACQSNLKQLGVALHTYGQDNKYIWPATCEPNSMVPNNANWLLWNGTSLFPYLYEGKTWDFDGFKSTIFKCPDSEKSFVGAVDTEPTHHSYGMNEELPAMGTPGVGFWRDYKKSSALVSPSRTMVLIDFTEGRTGHLKTTLHNLSSLRHQGTLDWLAGDGHSARIKPADNRLAQSVPVSASAPQPTAMCASTMGESAPCAIATELLREVIRTPGLVRMAQDLPPSKLSNMQLSPTEWAM